MKSPTYPHYSKLTKVLDSESLKIYQKLTHTISLRRFIDFSSPKILKCTHNVLVMIYRNHVIKVIFQQSKIYRTELFYSHIFYPSYIHSLALLEGCMLFLPLYGPSLKEYKDKMNSTILSTLRRDICLQIMNFHYNFVVHNDIKPSNIVRTHDSDENSTDGSGYEWRVIDFGLSEGHHPSHPTTMYFRTGTFMYNIPNITDIEFTHFSSSRNNFFGCT